MSNLGIAPHDRGPESPLARSPRKTRELPFVTALKQKLPPVAQVNDLFLRAQLQDDDIFQAVLDELSVTMSITGIELARVPADWRLLIVSDRPFGILDAAVLAAVLRRVRTDVKILADRSLRHIACLAEHCIFVDPAAGRESTSANAAALFRCTRWLASGGALVIFPATGVPQSLFPRDSASRPGWDPNMARLARITGAATLPIVFRKKHNPASQALHSVPRGIVHPNLRSTLLLSEFLIQKGASVTLDVGRAIPASTLAPMGNDTEAAHYVRWRTFLLAQRGQTRDLTSVLRPVLPKPRRDRLTHPVPSAALVADLRNLNPDQILDDFREFTVFAARAHQIPNILPELGRLRELTFREAGEGTGRSTDLDSFDRYYTHIVLWSKQNQEPVGAYRIGATHDILPIRGLTGLYTHTLFRFHPMFFEKLGPALELGRSFVRPEYQRQFAPLLLLWKGIATYISRHPETPLLFGAVSISGRYTRASRELIVRFFESRNSSDELAQLVQPRRAFRPARIRSWDCRSICHAMHELDQLSDPIADSETDGKSIPILIKHYSRLGGRLLGFNVDARFSHVLDGLVVMDLRQTQPSTLERYMGKSGLATFRSYHGLPCRKGTD